MIGMYCLIFQVRVSVNNVACHCKADCSFEWSIDATPVMNSLDKYQGKISYPTALDKYLYNTIDS